MKSFISLTWTEDVSDREAKVLIHTVAETLIRIGERVGPWLESSALPSVRPFGDWVILQMPRGSAYSSVDWYLDRCHTSDGKRIDGPAYLRLVELEPWQSSTPHFDVALVAKDLADAEGRSELNMALPGLAAVASMHRLHRSDRGLRAPRELVYERLAKVALHETAHALGLTHCRQDQCLMRFSPSLERLDELRLSFCPRCELRLEESRASLLT